MTQSRIILERVVDECLTLKLAPDGETLVGDVAAEMPAGFLEWLGRESLSPREIAWAWEATLGHNFRNRERAAIFVFSLFRAHFASQSTRGPIDEALRGLNLSVRGSWKEATRRLAGALFYLGRFGEPTPEKRECLSRAVVLIDLLLVEDRFISPANLIRYHGFKGVACVLLARASSNALEKYEQAAACLRRSRAAGDTSLENGEYLAESQLHLCEITRDTRWLDEAEALLGELRAHPKAGRRVWSMTGEAGIIRGQEWAKAGRHGPALESLHGAERDLTRALGLSVRG